MANCFLESLSSDIVNDCDNITKSGIETDVVLIPRKDIDFSASTVDQTNRMLITDIVLKAQTTGYLLEGVKQLNGYSWEFVPSEETIDRYRHTFNGVIMTPSAKNRLEMSKLARGEQYVAVVNKKYKGADRKDAFLVLGWDTGMYVTAQTENSKESDAAIQFTLSNKDNELEDEAPRIVLDTDYSTTLTAFNNKFAQGSGDGGGTP